VRGWSGERGLPPGAGVVNGSMTCAGLAWRGERVGPDRRAGPGRAVGGKRERDWSNRERGDGVRAY
jgi:hypothetical protein